MHNQAPDTVYEDCICANCDTPAAHKFNGLAGHSHDMHPCPYCDVNILDVDDMSGYDDSMYSFCHRVPLIDRDNHRSR